MLHTTLLPAVAAGVGGLLLFLLMHHLWIRPIWFILPMGLVIAVLGGLAVGRAYQHLLPRLPPRPWTVLAMVGLVMLNLLPAIVLAELRQPMFNIDLPDPRLNMGSGEAAVIFILELLLTSALVGGLLGWLIGRSREAALSTALAGFLFALGPGHNIPFLGNTPAAPKGFVLLLAVISFSSLLLVELHYRIGGES